MQLLFYKLQKYDDINNDKDDYIYIYSIIYVKIYKNLYNSLT